MELHFSSQPLSWQNNALISIPKGADAELDGAQQTPHIKVADINIKLFRSTPKEPLEVLVINTISMDRIPSEFPSSVNNITDTNCVTVCRSPVNKPHSYMLL
jgi:hypothetical protein